jgi:aconitate hydratase
MIDVRRRLPGTDLDFYSLSEAERAGLGEPGRLPVTVKVLLEALLRAGATEVSQRALAAWPAPPPAEADVPFLPARVLLQDLTGVPAIVDLAAMRSAMRRAGRDVGQIDPQIPVDLVADHSVQVDVFGSARSYRANVDIEYQRNGERYALLRWAQGAFQNFRVVPPGMGICHQVNLEHLSRVVQIRDGVAIPDTLVGADSHTTMVNGLGVLGWGVGGIEAEACMLGQPIYLPTPVVVGVRFSNSLPAGATATDLVLTLTEMLRRHGVVNKFVEFCGDGLSSLTVADRATLSNMCPEYGATSGLFPIDAQTLRYLEMTGRGGEHSRLVERYCREQGTFRDDGAATPVFSELLELDLAAVEPSVAGPKRPQDRVPLGQVWESFHNVFHPEEEAPDSIDLERFNGESQRPPAVASGGGVATAARAEVRVRNGSVVIAAITSCTNTSNPTVMVAAGILARNAVRAGLSVPAYVKTSLAPGSKVVTDYLTDAGLLEYLETLGFYLVGYGCTTCIGNSGPLASPEVEAEVTNQDLSVVAVLSGNRNFEARIHQLVKASYLASPPLVVAYALAGTIRRDLTEDPLGHSAESGRAVYLRDIWPSRQDVEEVIERSVRREMFEREYSTIWDGDENWQRMAAPSGAVYDWDPSSTYVREPPYLDGFAPEPAPLADVLDARALVVVGDSVTTDHISPAGAFAAASPAGQYLIDQGVDRADFNTYGARRGNHEVMVRGTFANIRLHNELAGGREGYWTRHQPSGDEMTIYDASLRYRQEGVPLVVIAGREYGTGSSRDWAAKGPNLLGVRAVIAESYERIHRSNLIGMGIVPLQFGDGEGRQALGLTGEETFTIRGLAGGLRPRQELEVEARRGDEVKRFKVVARLDNETEVGYLRQGGVLPAVLRQLIR